MIRLPLLIGVAACAALAQSPVPATAEDGRKVLLFPDGTWKPVAASTANPMAKPPASRPPSATQRLTFPNGEGALWLNPAKWKEVAREGNRVTLQHSNGKLFGLILAEGIGGASTPAMRQVALVNAQRQDPSARIVSERFDEKDGRRLLFLRLDATLKGIPFSFAGYYHGGVKSNLQVLVYTTQSEFAALESEIREYLAGLQVLEASAPETAVPAPAAPTAAPLAFGHFSLDIGTDWKSTKDEEGVYLLSHKSGDLYLKFIAEQIEIPLDKLRDIIVANLKKEARQVEVIEEKPVELDGKRGVRLILQADPGGIPLKYLIHAYGGPFGTLQLTGYTGRNIFDEKRALLEALVGRIKIANR